MAMPPTARGPDSVPESLPTETEPGEDPVPQVIEMLYRIEAGNLSRYFGRYLRGHGYERRHDRVHDEASDYVHEAFARLVRSMSAQPILQPHRYLRRIARHLLFERSRRLRRQPCLPDVPLPADLEPSCPPEQSHRLEYDDMLRAYRRALDELPAKTREVFLLHRIDELAYSEIGQRLGISIPTVQYHMARALAHIDAVLGQE